MPSVSKNALVPYSASKMYDLVDDIAAYPEFLPWCASSEVISRTQDEAKACVEISHSGVHKTFTTRNLTQPGKMIEILTDNKMKEER